MNKPRTLNSISVVGFTIMEIMVTLIIVAIVTAIAMPLYNKTVDEMHKKEAKTALGTIRSAEQMYKIDNNNYTSATFGSDNNGNTARSTLNVDIYNNADWEYAVTGVSGTGLAARATATAARLRGKHKKGGTDPGVISINITDGETIADYSW
ncbi:MAG: prepilin-type N-terminal cleavage/methylation domain-containing protein [Candidatus Omnitrophota bacterium]|nr:prepilin-type N-terminal cleavage/methylation domain-containing protein [Candidatus Omnitrophota bacterium]